MLNAIIEASLRHRFIVLALTALLVATGTHALLDLPLDAFPDTTPVQVQVNTVASALSPLEMEQQITLPIEQVMGGLRGLKELRSSSRFALSQVTLIFYDQVDIESARQLVMERLATVTLPDGIERPAMGPVATGLGEVFHYIISSRTRDLTELRAIQDWMIKPRLQMVSGVAEVNSWGGFERQYQVIIDPARLLKHDLTLVDVLEALQRTNRNVGGGVITQAGGTLLVQGIGLLETLDQVGDVVITAERGVPIHIRDIGQAVEGHEIRAGAVTFDGRGEAVMGLGFMLMGHNSHEVTAALKSAMRDILPTLPTDIEVTTVYDRTEIVDHVLRTVRTNLLEGAILVLVVLLLFLGNFRAGLIVAAAIPLSMLFAGNLMLRAGIAGSLMSLGAIDFGLIVDSSVITVENSVRHLAIAGNRPVLEVVRDATVEVRRPTLFGELIIMIVYLPILTLEDIEGKMFAPMAWTVIFALAGSLILSLTVIPVLASLLLPARVAHREPLLVRGLKRLYAPVLSFVLRRRPVALSLLVILPIVGLLIAPRLGAVFIPRLSEEAVVINTVRLAGVSVEESVRYGTRLEQLLKEHFPDEIRHIWSRTGTAEVATDPMGVELTDIFLTLHPRAQWKQAATQEALVAKMESLLGDMPGMRTIFTQPIELRVNELIAGIRSDLGVKIFGDDFDTLAELAERIESVLREVPGAADPVVEQLTGQPVLEIRLRQAELARHGLPADEVLNFVAAVGNIPVGEIRQNQMRFPLTVRLPDQYRRDPGALAKLQIRTASGQQLELGHLADIATVQGPATINRDWSKRRGVVQVNVRGRDVAGFVADAQRRIGEQVKLPPGYFIRYEGQFEHLQRGSARLMIVVPLALGLIFLLLYITYGRMADVIRIATTLPLAAVGGLVALYLRGLPFSISAGVGFVAMSGVSVLGDMVFVSYLRGLLASGVPLAEAITQTALVRLRPVLMTGLVASLGFVPMAFNTGVGAEVQRPLATVVIGSVITSTLLTLVILPVLYTYAGRWGRKTPPPSA